MRNIRLQFVILAMVFASFGIVQLGRALQDFHRNYFWTPTTRQESLEKGKDSFEIYVRGQLLNRRLQAGELALKMGESWSPLQESDVTVRLNHIHEVTRTPLNPRGRSIVSYDSLAGCAPRDAIGKGKRE